MLKSYPDEELERIKIYAPTLTFTRKAKRIGELAAEALDEKTRIRIALAVKEQEEALKKIEREAERLRIEKEEGIKKDFQKLILNSSEKNMEVVNALYNKDSHLMESVVCVQKECPLLFEGEDVVELLKNDTVLVRDLLQFYFKNKELLVSICNIKTVVANRTIESFYNAIPSPALIAIVQLLPPLDSPSGSIDLDDADILRYYVVRASKPHTAGDILIWIIEKVLKKLLGMSFLPLPSVTTVCLFCNWVAMLHYLTKKHYGEEFLSMKKIAAIGISVLAVLMQLLNRETPLKLVRSVYSGSVQVKDFLSGLPTDAKKKLMMVLGVKEVDESVLNLALKNRIVTYNNNLGYFAGIDNLSMNKALDMLYTFRIGDTFVQFAETGQGLEIHSLSDYWEKYGPLPEDGQQVEALLDLFRNDKKTYDERVKAIYVKYKQFVVNNLSYENILGCCGKIYDEMSRLNMYYLPFTYQETPLFEIIPITDHNLIFMIAGWAKDNSNNDKISSRSQAEVAEDIFCSITNWVKYNK